MPRRRTKRAAATFESLLDAALRVFVERGYYGTSVPDVAREAGVANGTMYHHFPSKEALVNALYRRWKDRVASIVFTEFPTAAEPREQFRSMWHALASFARENPRAFAFMELHNHASYLDAESQALENRLKEFTTAFVERAQTLGQLKPIEPALLIELVFGAFNGMMRTQWERRVDLTDEKVEAAEAACWDMVRLID